MNKSTPLNQLPNMNTSMPPQSPSGFVSDQQRQIVAQAQQAASTFSLPQSTQLSNDVGTDDDATVQEVLNHLNQSNPMNTNTSVGEDQMYEQHQLQQQQQQQQSLYQNAPAPAPAMYMSPQAPMMPMPIVPSSRFSMFVPHSLTSIVFDDDLKIIAIAAVAYIAVHYIPFERFVNNYVALYKIPYSSFIIKALSCGFIVFILKKLFVRM